MDINILSRRKTLLKLYYADSLNATTVRAMADQEGIKESTLRKDWGRRKIWEPLVWAMNDCRNDPEEILKGLQLARAQALKLMSSADQDSVKVAAIGKYLDTITLEVELRQSLGKLPRVAEKLEIDEKLEQVIIDATDDEATILSKAAAILERKSRSGGIH